MAARKKSEGPWGGLVFRALRDEVARGWPAGLTVLTGDDAYHLDAAQRLLLEHLAPEGRGAVGGLTVVSEGPTKVADVVGMARSGGMFASRRVVLVRDPSALDGDPDPLAAYASRPPEGSHLLVRAPRLDRKRKLHQVLATAGRLLTFAAPGPGDASEARRELIEMARARGLRLGGDAADFLLEACAADLLRAAAELDKVRDYVGDSRDAEVSVDLLRGLVSGSEAMTGFELSDALLRRDDAEALAWVRRYADAGEEPLRILGTMAWRARGMVQAKALLEAGAGAGEAVAALKAWRIGGEVPGLLARYRWEEVLAFPARLLSADLALKSRSIPGRAVLEALAQDLTRSAARDES